MHLFHILDDNGLGDQVAISSIRHRSDVKMGIADGEITFRKYLQTAESGLHGRLSEQFPGGDYGQQLVEADPEVDLEQVGQFVGPVDSVHLTGSSEVLYAPPRLQEVLISPEGEVCDTQEPVDQLPNVREEDPVCFTKKRFPKLELARRFVIARTVQLQHTSSLQYQWLHKMAKELAEKDEVVMLAGGPKCNEPLRFQLNGTPHRAFLEGRVDGEKYKLLMHLSNFPIKRDGGGFKPRFKEA